MSKMILTCLRLHTCDRSLFTRDISHHLVMVYCVGDTLQSTKICNCFHNTIPYGFNHTKKINNLTCLHLHTTVTCQAILCQGPFSSSLMDIDSTVWVIHYKALRSVIVPMIPYHRLLTAQRKQCHWMI